MTDISRLRGELVERVLYSEATADRDVRRAAFDNALSDGPIRTLIEKVADRSYTVTDDDIAAVRAIGLTEDQIFELIVCAAVGVAERQYTAATAALAEAEGEQR